MCDVAHKRLSCLVQVFASELALRARSLPSSKRALIADTSVEFAVEEEEKAQGTILPMP